MSKSNEDLLDLKKSLNKTSNNYLKNAILTKPSPKPTPPTRHSKILSPKTTKGEVRAQTDSKSNSSTPKASKSQLPSSTTSKSGVNSPKISLTSPVSKSPSTDSIDLKSKKTSPKASKGKTTTLASTSSKISSKKSQMDIKGKVQASSTSENVTKDPQETPRISKSPKTPKRRKALAPKAPKSEVTSAPDLLKSDVVNSDVIKKSDSKTKIYENKIPENPPKPSSPKKRNQTVQDQPPQVLIIIKDVSSSTSHKNTPSLSVRSP